MNCDTHEMLFTRLIDLFNFFSWFLVSVAHLIICSFLFYSKVESLHNEYHNYTLWLSWTTAILCTVIIQAHFISNSFFHCTLNLNFLGILSKCNLSTSKPEEQVIIHNLCIFTNVSIYQLKHCSYKTSMKEQNNKRTREVALCWEEHGQEDKPRLFKILSNLLQGL